MMTYQTPLALAQKLISLPSYVSGKQDETPMTDFLAGFLKDTFPEIIVEKQYLRKSKRCNLILRGRGATELFVLGHIDTVQPKDSWRTNPFEPIVQDGKLYGLGAADMKSSLAAFLWALMQNKQDVALDNLLLLMYVDEECDFKGIRRFIGSDVADIKPELTLSLDGELAVGTGCRGLIELSLTFKGKSGHAANPTNGVNAVTRTAATLEAVSQELGNFSNADLGPTTTNLAYMQGGTTQESGREVVWLQEGNVIPDTAEVIFEVRPATAGLNAKLVRQKIKRAAKAQGLEVAKATIRHDITPWPVQYDKQSLVLLRSVYTKADVPFRQSDRKLQGYIDAQMVAEKIPAPTFIIGTGGENKHGANENVPLENIEQAARLYQAILGETIGTSAQPNTKEFS